MGGGVSIKGLGLSSSRPGPPDYSVPTYFSGRNPSSPGFPWCHSLFFFRSQFQTGSLLPRRGIDLYNLYFSSREVA